GKSDDGRSCPAPLPIGNHLGSRDIHHRDARVRRAEINPEYFWHWSVAILTLMLGSAHSDLDQRRAEQPVMKEVPLLKNSGHGLRGDGRVFLPNDSFVNLGIEWHSGLIDGPKTVALQDVPHLLVDEEHTLVKIVAFFGVLQRAIEIVDHRQEVLQYAGEGVLVEVGLLSIGALA